MTTTYRRKNSQNSSDGIEWGITVCVIATLIIITGLPTVLLGLIVWRLVPRSEWSWLLWLALALSGGYVVFFLYTHGLEGMLLKEWRDYSLAMLHAQFDIRLLPLAKLWSETWPVWLRTLPAFGFVGLLQECNSQMQGSGQTAHQLEREERQRLRRIDRRAHHARRRAKRPEHVPDMAGGHMVIGIAIDDREQE